MPSQYPSCPLRHDARCMGAPCALSVRVGRPDGGGEYHCALAGDGGGRAVTDVREGRDPCART